MKEIQKGIYRDGDLIFTEAASDQKVYGENFMKENGREFRRWEASRSKIGAAVQNGVELGIREDDEVLYLGAASGTTVSHVSDIVNQGSVFAVEYSETVARDLVEVAESRENIAPVIADARNPEEYKEVLKPVDVVFQDISQKDQAEILMKNCRKYLRDSGKAMIAIKAQSVSSARKPEEVFDEIRQKLNDMFEIQQETLLDPYETDHLFLVMSPR
jgi:fibrillarin-like pre-rRNA processing protein